MFGKNARMNTLATRKQLLLAESELNRARLIRDMAELSAGVRTLTGRAKSFTSIFPSSRRAGIGPGGLPARQARGRRCKTSVAAEDSRRRGNDFLALDGVPFTGARSQRQIEFPVVKWAIKGALEKALEKACVRAQEP
jgi:hypothetical protein